MTRSAATDDDTVVGDLVRERVACVARVLEVIHAAKDHVGRHTSRPSEIASDVRAEGWLIHVAGNDDEEVPVAGRLRVSPSPAAEQPDRDRIQRRVEPSEERSDRSKVERRRTAIAACRTIQRDRCQSRPCHRRASVPPPRLRASPARPRARLGRPASTPREDELDLEIGPTVAQQAQVRVVEHVVEADAVDAAWRGASLR